MSDAFTAGAMQALRGALSGVDPKTGKPVDEKGKAVSGAALSALGGYVFTGESIKQATPGILGSLMDELGKLITEPSYNLAKTFLDNLVSSGTLKTETREQLLKTFESMKEVSPFIVVALVVSMIVGYVKSLLSGSMALAEQNVYSGMRPTIPGVSEVIRAVFMDPTTTEKWRDVARKTGIREDYLSMILKSQYSPLDVGTIRELYFRRGLDKDLAVKRLRELALTDERIAELMETWKVIPGPQDIIRMAVREAFSPDQVASLGLDADFPSAVEEWAGKVGLSDPWPKMYWRAHWELPSAQMGFEMLHRREITMEELSSLLKALDYAPVWHERLRNIAYNVVTRVDARRLYGMGVWTEEKLREAYERMGYAPDDAEDLTAWTKVEYAQGDKELTRSQIEKAYAQHIVDRREAESLIGSLGYSEERTGWILDMAEFASASEERTAAIAAVKDSFLAGLMGDTEVRDRLGREEVDANYIETLIMRWRTVISTTRKLPSKTDLDKFLKAGIIAEVEYKEELTRLGYSRDMAARYYQLNTAG